jgi:hypothetical protein
VFFLNAAKNKFTQGANNDPGKFENSEPEARSKLVV